MSGKKKAVESRIEDLRRAERSNPGTLTADDCRAVQGAVFKLRLEGLGKSRVSNAEKRAHLSEPLAPQTVVRDRLRDDGPVPRCVTANAEMG